MRRLQFERLKRGNTGNRIACKIVVNNGIPIRRLAIAVNLRIKYIINDCESWFFTFFGFNKQVLYNWADK